MSGIHLFVRGRMKGGWELAMLVLLLSALLSACGGGYVSPPPPPPPVSAYVWTWVSGDNEPYGGASYGTQGVADPLNVPGARYEAVSWLDPSGKFWLFGGNGLDWMGTPSCLNDLWKFDPATPEWTWVSGSYIGDQWGVYGTKGLADPANVPGARVGAVSWLDPGGKLWLFGGWYSPGYGAIRLNDLWEFDPATLEWTWVSGSDIGGQWGIYGTKGTADPANVPGGRAGAVSWIDPNGKLWLFGGYGLDEAGAMGELNDLWKFDPATLEWTWVSGSNIGGQWGIYGTKGTADPANFPGARDHTAAWIDPNGNFWLFGGSRELNDLWKFDPATLEWTWVSGSNEGCCTPGNYGTMGKTAPSNVAGARTNAVSWIDPGGKLWLFGGYGWDCNGDAGRLQDLWKFDPDTHEWTWESGSCGAEHEGVYGTKGTADPDNVPGTREGAVSWIDSSGQFWLFGGLGVTTPQESGWLDSGWLNDLWKCKRR